MKAKFSITYTVSTEESAHVGDFADHGWWMPGSLWYSLVGSSGSDVLHAALDGSYDLSFREAVKCARDLGCNEHSFVINGASFSSSEPQEDRPYFEKGESRFYTLHCTEVSLGTAKRIKGLLS